MRKVIFIILCLFAQQGFTQDFFTLSRKSPEMKALYVAKFEQSGNEEEPPVPTTTQKSKTSYNPYALTDSTAYNSIGSYSIILKNIPESIDYSTDKLFIYVTQGFNFVEEVYAAAVKEGNTIRIDLQKQDINLDGGTYIIFLYVIKY